jgi:uncharacterized membrane protein
MTLAPRLKAPVVIPFHAALAFAAIFLGAAQFLAPKRALPHRCAVGLGHSDDARRRKLALHPYDPDVGPWSPIHPLSLFTLAVVPVAVWRARRHDAGTHRQAMIWIFTLALVATEQFTLAPGRIMNELVFGG